MAWPLVLPRAFYKQEHPSEYTLPFPCPLREELVIVLILCTKAVSDDWHGGSANHEDETGLPFLFRCIAKVSLLSVEFCDRALVQFRSPTPLICVVAMCYIVPTFALD